MNEISPDALAARTAELMYERDKAAHALGIVVEEVRAGWSRLSMMVREDMLNGHATIHGGFTFTLADTAFAYACNSHDRITVAAGADIDFVSAGRLGERLVAVARERSRAKRIGVYDIDVTEAVTGRLIAVFRGRSYSLEAKLTETYAPK